jgi:hypothetical protein
VTVPLVFADLGFSSDVNGTRVNELGRGNLVDNRPLTTPGFELVLAVAAVAVAGAATRRRGGGAR